MSATMRAAVLYGKEDVRLEDRPLPKLQPGEILLKIKAALTCGTDLKVFRNGGHARMLIAPTLFGHEFSGIIEAVGPGVTSWKPGVRVVAANSAPCGSCFFCAKGKPNLCKDLLFVNGAYAQFLQLPRRVMETNLLEIPDHLSFEAAALTEPLACVVRGIEAAQLKPGETAAILGAGPVGLMFAQLAAHRGAQVLLVGKGKARLKAAQACGAHKIFDLETLADPITAIRQETPEGLGADCVIEAVGRPAAWSQAIEIVRPGGRVLLFGGCPSGTKVELDAGRFHYEELTILSTFHHTPEAIRESLRLLSEGQVHPEPLITGTAPLEELPQTLRRMLAQQDGVKTAILP
jgi:L-iditol 2-dehydrogenase